ncbi:MAG: hypothetical protein U5L96_02305 [Owenweeksia sp.]|nr:hypothetical protein [Owenweeksia sp.]
MSADVFAKKLLRFMKKKKFHTYIGNKELLAVPTAVPLRLAILYKMLRE